MRDELIEGFILVLANHDQVRDYEYGTEDDKSGCICGWTEPVPTELGYDRHLAEVLADAGGTINVHPISQDWDIVAFQSNGIAEALDWLRKKATATSVNPRWWGTLLNGGLSITCGTVKTGAFRAEVDDVISILPNDGGVAVYTRQAWEAQKAERRRVTRHTLDEVVEWIVAENPDMIEVGTTMMRVNGTDVKSGDSVVRLARGEFVVMTHAQEQRFARAGRHEFGV